MAEVADRSILAEVELRNRCARGSMQAPSRGPDDIAVDDLPEVIDYGVTVVGRRTGVPRDTPTLTFVEPTAFHTRYSRINRALPNQHELGEGHS
jgi:hypothetical protein